MMKNRTINGWTRLKTVVSICCLALMVGCLTWGSAIGQTANSYAFSASAGTFTPIASQGTPTATSLTATADDGLSTAFSIGFSFTYAGTSYTNVRATSNGVLSFGTGSTSAANNLSTATPNRPAVAPLWDDLLCTSGVRYLLTGSAPNRVLTVEWLNMRWNYQATGPVISFQAKLYETSNVVEFVYNQEATAYNAGATQGASIGIMGTANSDYISVQNTSASPTTSTTSSTNNLTVKPASGQVYTFTPQSPCAAPTTPASLVTSGLSSSGATVSWGAANGATSYDYEVRTSGACGSGASGLVASGNVSSPTVTLTGLNAATAHTFCVRSVCTGTSSFASTSFTTLCNAFSLPLNEGFNGSTRPSCWTEQFVTSASAMQFVASSSSPTTTPFEGSHYAFWNSFSISSGNSTRLVSPQLITTGTPSVDVKFQWFNENSTAYNSGVYLNEGVQVQWSTNGTTWTDAGAFIPRFDGSLALGTGQWNLKTVTLPASAGNQPTVFIGFKFISFFGKNCSMDAVGIEATPACPSVNAITASAVTPATATVSWTAASGAVSYDYEVRTSGACGSGASGLFASGNTTGTSINLTGLAEGTAYTVCVITNCSANQSSANTGSFITPLIPPVNDDCANAIAIPCGGSVSGNNTAATDEIGLPSCGSSSANFRGMWYTYTPTASGSTTLATCGGATWDTYLRIFTGSCGSLSCVSSNDDGCNSQSTITFNATAGTTYYVLVTGFNSSVAFGAFTLTNTVTPATIGSISGPSTLYCGVNNTYSVPSVSGLTYNWTVTNGTLVSGQGTNSVVLNLNGGGSTVAVTASDVCGGVATTSSTFTCTPPPPCNDGTIVNAGSVSGTTCGAGNESSLRSSTELIYQWTVTTGGCYTISTCASTGGFDSYLYLTTLCPGIGGTSGGGSVIASNDDDANCGTSSTIEVTVVPGTYYITVEGFFSTSCGAFNLDVQACPPPPVNDDCANATPFVGNAMPFTTVRATGTDVTSCTLGDTKDVWFSFVAPSCGQVTFSTCGTATFDTGLALFTSCGGTELACNDDFTGCNFRSQITATVAAGVTYYLRVAGYNGAEGTGSVSMTMTTPLSVTTSGTNVSCFGGNNGSAAVVAAGGTGSYSYLWSNGSTAASQSGLTAGTYTVTVTDGIGCTATASVTVTEPTALSGGLIAFTYIGGANVSCNGAADGSIFANISDGTAPYTYAWSNGGNTQMITGLTAGNYSVVVTDANGCVYAPAAIILTEPAAMANSAVVSSFSCGFNVSCNGANNGSIDLTVTGGSGNYMFQWSNGATTEDLSGLTAGTYSVLATDQNGCSTSASFTITQPALLTASLTTSLYGCGFGVSCNGATNGSVTAAVAGGCAPYTYAWSTGGIGGSINGVAAGTYNVTVTDANGCQAFATAELTQPAALTVACPGNVTVYNGWAPSACATLTAGAISGGCAPYTIAWSNGATGASTTVCPTVSTDYIATVTDANGCTASCTVRVCVIDVRCGNNLQKIEICHNGNTLCVSPNAVQNHLNHGDYLGSCGSNVPCGAPLKTGGNSGAAAYDHVDGVEMEAFPNPFQSSTTLRFVTPGDDQVSVTVFAMDGRNMGTIFEGVVEGSKTYEVDFNAEGAANGIYFAKLTTSNGAVTTMKLILMK